MIRKKKNNIIYHILTLLGGILMLYPLIWMLMSSFKETNTIINTATQLFPEVVTFDNYQNVWSVYQEYSIRYTYRSIWKSAFILSSGLWFVTTQV